jgi:putative phosphoesterase
MQRLPDQVFRIFRGVDLILHAGDVDRIEYLSDLTTLAPLHAVRGNLHFGDLSDGGYDLPVELQLTVAGYSVVVNHGGWPDLWSQATDWFVESLLRPGGEVLNQRIASRLARLNPGADVILFGHSHRPYRAWHDGTLIFNPGAVCPTVRRVPSVGRLYLGPNTVEAEAIPLA